MLSNFFWDNSNHQLTLGKFSPLQQAGISHAITTRDWPHSMLALTDPGQAAEHLADSAKVKQVAWMKQVHRAEVIKVLNAGLAGDADAMITDQPELGLVARSADCPLVLLAAPNPKAIGIFHAGWRGTVAGIASETIRSMVLHYSCDPSEIIACICPSAGVCCYEIGEEVYSTAIEKIGPKAKKFFIKNPTKPMSLNFDMWACITDQLLRVGLKKANIHNAQLCTLCHNNIFPSFRTEGDGAGRFQAIISL